MPTGTKDSGDSSARGRDFKIGDRCIICLHSSFISPMRAWAAGCLGHPLAGVARCRRPFWASLLAITSAEAVLSCCRVVVASTGKRSAQQLTGVDGDVIGLDGNGWVIVRTSDGSETLRIQQRYLSKQSNAQEYEVIVPRD